MADAPPAHATVVGIPEIAAALGRTRHTVDNWLNSTKRGLLSDPFPPARWTVGGRPAWHLPDVLEWAEATGRLERVIRE